MNRLRVLNCLDQYHATNSDIDKNSIDNRITSSNTYMGQRVKENLVATTNKDNDVTILRNNKYFTGYADQHTLSKTHLGMLQVSFRHDNVGILKVTFAFTSPTLRTTNID